MILIHRIAQGIVFHELFSVLPAVIVGASEQDADIEVDVDEIGRHQLVVDHDPGRDVHGAAPFRHLFIGVIAYGRIVERSPASQQHAPPTYLFISG